MMNENLKLDSTRNKKRNKIIEGQSSQKFARTLQKNRKKTLKCAKEKSTNKKIKDSEIDYSEIPKFSAKDLKNFKRVGRPIVGESPRRAISVRIEEDILEKLKNKAEKAGVGYQSLINDILKKAI